MTIETSIIEAKRDALIKSRETLLANVAAHNGAIEVLNELLTPPAPPEPVPIPELPSAE